MLARGKRFWNLEAWKVQVSFTVAYASVNGCFINWHWMSWVREFKKNVVWAYDHNVIYDLVLIAVCEFVYVLKTLQ